MLEQRRHERSPINQSLTFSKKGTEAAAAGTGTDISVGGMFIQTEHALPFGSEIVVKTKIPGGGEAIFALPGVVRWSRPDGMGVQFGLLGAKETHLITEIARKLDQG